MEGGGDGLENEDTGGGVGEDHSSQAKEAAGLGEKAAAEAGLGEEEVCDYEEEVV